MDQQHRLHLRRAGFLLFAFFGGFAIMLGAEFNAAIQEEWPAPATHARRLRRWLAARTRPGDDGDTSPARRCPDDMADQLSSS